MDYRDYYMRFYKDYYRDPFPHSLLSTRKIRHPKLRTPGEGGGSKQRHSKNPEWDASLFRFKV